MPPGIRMPLKAGEGGALTRGHTIECLLRLSLLLLMLLSLLLLLLLLLECIALHKWVREGHCRGCGLHTDHVRQTCAHIRL